METRQLIRAYEEKQRLWQQEAERMIEKVSERLRNDIQEVENGHHSSFPAR